MIKTAANHAGLGGNRAGDSTDSEGATPDHALLHCDRCQQPHAAEQRFCTHCGAALWEPCPNCNETGPVGQAFCGACGAKRDDVLAQRRRRLEEVFERADQLRGEGRHEEAIGLLQTLRQENGSRNGQLAERAGELIRSLAEEHERGRARATDVLSRAEAFVERARYEQAVRLIESLPVGLRDEPLRRLYERADDARHEVASLERTLASAPDGRVSLADARNVQRLLTLAPSHPAATRRASQLGRSLLTAGRQYLEQCRYREAHRALQAIPDVAATGETEELRAHVAEVAWLLEDLKTATVVDPILPLVAQRLASQRPQDARLTQVAATVRQRAQRFLQSDALEFPAWQTPPADPALGCPVDWATGLGRIGVGDAEVRGLLRQYSARFWVAAGLALQGLGKGSLSVNLMPHDARGRLARWVGPPRLRPVTTAWGIDLGASGLKAVKLDVSGKDGRVAIGRCDLIEHAKPLGQTADAAEKLQCIRDTIAQFLQRHVLGTDRVCIGFPGRHALYRAMDMPPLRGSQATSAIALEARHQFPCALEDLIWQHQPLDRPVATEERSSRVFLAAAKRNYLQQRLAVFTELGVHPQVIQSDSLALYNFFGFEGQGEPATDKSSGEGRPAPAQAVLDVGSDATSLIVRAPGLVWSNTGGLGGDRFTRALAQCFRLPFAQAEQLKRNPTTAKDLVAVYEALDPLFDKLAAEVERSLLLFANAHRTHEVVRIAGVGGGLQVHGLLRRLQNGRTTNSDA
ncbi:MAG: pilus assembly protein PilM [Pirellulales bacterium]|nr:pilus assembly protein PilM [Pirellulales bacterium]